MLNIIIKEALQDYKLIKNSTDLPRDFFGNKLSINVPFILLKLKYVFDKIKDYDCVYNSFNSKNLQFISIELIPQALNRSFDFLFKFILIGDSSVGKSCLLNHFVQGKFKKQHDPTLGVQFGCKNISIDGLALRIQIWDTAGQESFKSITRSYYKGSIAAFLVFDISRRVSFTNLSKWIYEIKNYSHADIQIVLVGNKSDLNQIRQVSIQQAQALALQFNYEYFETSALNGQKLNPPFYQTCKKILHKIKVKQLNPEENCNGIKMGKKKDPKKLHLSNSSLIKNEDKCKC